MSGNATLEDDQEPALVKAETVWFAAAIIVVALGLSITTNTYHDLHAKSAIPWGIPLAFGIAIPVMIAIISHTAATLNTHWGFRAAVAAPVAAFMAYSANAGIIVLTPVMQAGWAGVVTITIDTTAIVYLGVLVLAFEMMKRHAAWERREAARLKRAETEQIMARYGRGAGKVQVPGTGGGISPGAAGGITPPAVAGTAPHPAIAAGDPAPVDPVPVDRDPADDENGTVTPFRRPAQSPEEMLTAAAMMAADLAVIGEEITGRGYRQEHGGKPARINPVIAEVKEAMQQLGGLRGRPAAERIVTEVRAARDRAGQGAPAAGAR